jgi:hypothetical protein
MLEYGQLPYLVGKPDRQNETGISSPGFGIVVSRHSGRSVHDLEIGMASLPQ